MKRCAFVPKEFSYSNKFEKQIVDFLQNFSIDDQEIFDLLSFKNSNIFFTDLTILWKFKVIQDVNCYILEKWKILLL